jgi:hypothetical protein
MLGLLVASSVGLGYASIQLHYKRAEPRLSMREMIAIRRYDVHEAAKARNAKAREVCPIEQAVRPINYALLYGQAPATIGPAVNALDHSYTTQRGDEVIETRVSVADSIGECTSMEDPEVFCPFRCWPDPAQVCAQLREQLRTAWGDPVEGVWRDRSRRVLARTVENDNCELRFQSYVEPRAWIAVTETAEIPLALLGEPATRLGHDERRGERAYLWPWTLRVTGDHMLQAIGDVEIDDQGRIAQFQVTGEVEYGGLDEVHALVRTYRRGFDVELETHGTRFDLRIGLRR